MPSLDGVRIGGRVDAVVKGLKAVIVGCAGVAVTASSIFAACGFCAEEVTLSAPLAKCYLDRLDEERAAAARGQSGVHLVDLSFCLLSRSATSLPDVQTEGVNPVVLDEAFLIPVPALECLARSVKGATFDPETVLTFEVRVDCQN